MARSKQVAISDLTPFPNNPTTHSDDQIAILVASIQEFGFRGAIKIDENNVILAGHGRTEAAKLAGMEKIPCEVIDDFTDAQKQAYVLADNKIAQMAGLDVGILEMAVDNLLDDNFDVSLTGFREWELARLFHDDAGDGDSDSDSGGDESGTNRPVISVTIVFDDEQQKEKWYAFQRILKTEYPEALTTAQRLTSHIKSLAE